MNTISTHDKIKSQIVAFLFNTRADVLREDMYKALCLHVLSEIDSPCNIDDIVMSVAYAIGTNVDVTSSLRTIVVDELNALVSKGNIIKTNGDYSFSSFALLTIP